MQPELKLKVVTFGKALTSSPCKRGAVGQIYGRNETALPVRKQNTCSVKLQETKTGSRRTNEALSEQLGSLQINKEASTNYELMDTEMSTAPAATPAVNKSARMPKSMVLDPGWFDGDRMKFEDWWRGIRLFLKSNRVNRTDDRITAILACLRGGVAGIYAQKKLNELDDENNIQDWNNFIKEMKTMFSDKSKTADAE